MLCQNHTSPVSWLDGAEHSYGLESARVLPPIELVFLTLLLITDKSKSAPTCEIQTSCKSAQPCLCGRRMLLCKVRTWWVLEHPTSKEASWLFQLCSGFTGKVSVHILLNPTNCSQVFRHNLPALPRAGPKSPPPKPAAPTVFAAKGIFPNNQ